MEFELFETYRDNHGKYHVLVDKHYSQGLQFYSSSIYTTKWYKKLPDDFKLISKDGGKVIIEKAIENKYGTVPVGVIEKLKLAMSGQTFTKQEAKRQSLSDRSLITWVDTSAKRKGEAGRRFALYKADMTIAEYITAGGKKSDVVYDEQCGRIKVTRL